MSHIDLQNFEYMSWLKFLKESSNWTKEQIDKYQLIEIKRIINHAYYNTKGYNQFYNKIGFEPKDINNIKDFEHLPFIEKATIQNNIEDFSVSMEKFSYITTGGSTGVPFGFYRDSKSFSKELASKAHQYRRVGWNETDKQFVFRGQKIDTPEHMEFVPEFNELRCSSYHLTPQNMTIYLKEAHQYEPDWIRAYPSSLYIFANFLKDNGYKFPSIKGILCASENLYDFQKKLFRDVFNNTRVFSHYGNYELTALAGFCEYEDTYHVLPQYGYAELIDEQGNIIIEPGEMGEIVTTSFIMNATPFIRYKTQDFAILDEYECSSCKRPYQIWSRIVGRLQEFLITSDGRKISVTAMNSHDNMYDHIIQFQFHQSCPGTVVFQFVPKDSFSNYMTEGIHDRLMYKFDYDMHIVMQPVDKIQFVGRGKSPLVIRTFNQ